MNTLIEREINEVLDYYPELLMEESNGKGYYLSGRLSLIDNNGYNWGAYEIKIYIPSSYPLELPVLYETGKAIERQPHWHIDPDGVCCVGTPARQYRDMNNNGSVLKWIHLFVIPFLANHRYKIDRGIYVDGELSHGTEGIFEDYASCFDVKEPMEVIFRLSLILGYQELSLNATCFCKSGKKYKRCYLLHPLDHALGIPRNVLAADLKELRNKYPINLHLDNLRQPLSE